MKLVKLIIALSLLLVIMPINMSLAEGVSSDNTNTKTTRNMRKFSCNQMRRSDGDRLTFGFKKRFGEGLVKHAANINCGREADIELFKFGVVSNSVGAMDALIGYLEGMGGKQLLLEILNRKGSKNQNVLDLVKFKLDKAKSDKNKMAISELDHIYKFLASNGAVLSKP